MVVKVRRRARVQGETPIGCLRALFWKYRRCPGYRAVMDLKVALKEDPASLFVTLPSRRYGSVAAQSVLEIIM